MVINGLRLMSMIMIIIMKLTDLSFIQFKCPFTCQVSGPTKSGKTRRVRLFIRNHKLLFDQPVDKLRVLWCYSVWQDIYEKQISDSVIITYIKGIPSEEDLKENQTHLLVIDDLMNAVRNNEDFADLFTKGRHKVNTGIIFITQNVFIQGSQMQNIRLNCLYYVFMKSLQTKKQLQYFAREILPGKLKHVMESYDDATKDKPFTYIRIDLTTTTPEKYILTTNLVPEDVYHSGLDYAPTVYIPT